MGIVELLGRDVKAATKYASKVVSGNEVRAAKVVLKEGFERCDAERPKMQKITVK